MGFSHISLQQGPPIAPRGAEEGCHGGKWPCIAVWDHHWPACRRLSTTLPGAWPHRRRRPPAWQDAHRVVGQMDPRLRGKRTHICIACDFPIAVYGRCAPCLHAYCLACAAEMSKCLM